MVSRDLRESNLEKEIQGKTFRRGLIDGGATIIGD
jgi:hypothetical protein